VETVLTIGDDLRKQSPKKFVVDLLRLIRLSVLGRKSKAVVVVVWVMLWVVGKDYN